MQPTQVIVLAVLAFAIYLAWNVFRSRTGGIPLYLVCVAIAASLVGSAAAQLTDLNAAIEPLNVIAVALSLAAMPAPFNLWEQQMARDLQRTRVYGSLRPADLLTWRAMLKLVDRLGARGAALVYLGGFTVALLLPLAATIRSQPADAGLLVAVTIGVPAAFALLSALWVYRGARRLVPGA